jgi:membrane associated rhomboid family serine protease
MIPIRDNIPSRSFPLVNTILIVINVLVFIFELSLGQGQLESFILEFGVVPRRITSALTGHFPFIPAFLSLFTSIFLHGGWLHLLGNMLYLWIFGDNVEDRLGSVRYLILYFASGIAGTVAQVWFNPLAAEPVIGASGAIAGVLGAYFVTYPKAKIVTLLPILFFFTFIEIPAFVFLIIWFITQSLSGVLAIGATGNMVAWWAHIGGFILGVAGMYVLSPKKEIIDS